MLLKIEILFPLNNLSLLRPIDTNLDVWVAYIKTKLGIATQVSVIKVKVNVTMGSLYQDAANGIIFSSLPSFISYS